MKRLKKILIALNLILFAILYTTLFKNKQTSEDNINFTERTSNLKSFSLTSKNGDLNFTNEENEWFLNYPITWKANKLAVSKFITIITHLSVEKLFTYKEINTRGEKLSDYGLDENSTIINLENQNFSTKIKIGNKSYDESFYYSNIYSNTKLNNIIWKLPTDIEEIISMRENNWIDERLIQNPLYSINKISASFKINKDKTNKTTLIKNLDQWNFTEPFTSEANEDNTRLLLNKLLNLKISDNDFISKVKSDNNNSLVDNWQIRLEIAGNSFNDMYYFSNSLTDGNNKIRYCMTPSSNNLFKFSDDITTLLSDWSSKLRNRSIFDNKISEIKTIEIISNNSNFKLVNTSSDKWIATNEKQNGGTNFEADVKMINYLVKKLNTLEVKEYLSFNIDSFQEEEILDDENKITIKITNRNTTQKTLIISRKDNESSLWKTYIKEDSILCLIEDNLHNLANKRIFNYKSKKLINENDDFKFEKIRNLDSNNSATFISNENNTTLKKKLLEIEVIEYLNELSKHDGTWNKGDWVPWKYEINLIKDKADQKITSLKLSYLINQDYHLGNLDDNNLTFKLSNDDLKDLLILVSKN